MMVFRLVVVATIVLSLLTLMRDPAPRADASHTPDDMMSIRHSGGDPGPYGGGSVLIVPVGATFYAEIWSDAWWPGSWDGYQWEVVYDPAYVVHTGMNVELATGIFSLCSGATATGYSGWVLYGQGSGCLSPSGNTTYVGQLTNVGLRCIAPTPAPLTPTLVGLIPIESIEGQVYDQTFGSSFLSHAYNTASTRYKGPHPLGGTLAQISVVCANAADYPAEDFDGDGCSNSEELGTNQLTGGKRDPWNEYDFFDVPTPALSASMPNGTKNQAISLVDVGGPLAYVGTVYDGMPNPNGYDYDTDFNGNTVEDGAEYDRTPSMVPMQPWRSGAPNGAVSLQDVGVALAQVGTNCSAAP